MSGSHIGSEIKADFCVRGYTDVLGDNRAPEAAVPADYHARKHDAVLHDAVAVDPYTRR
jgi:hypothetical protein